MGNGGDQKKLFTSKSTLIFATAVCTIKFNNANNVTIDILANTWYEFYQNIHMVIIVTIGTDGTVYLYFEGALPEESRLGA
jgi:roadblock/LC7 domain-containing protein